MVRLNDYPNVTIAVNSKQTKMFGESIVHLLYIVYTSTVCTFSRCIVCADEA